MKKFIVFVIVIFVCLVVFLWNPVKREITEEKEWRVVSGRIAQDNWTNKEGEKQTKYKVIVDKVQLLGSPKGKKNNVATETNEEF